MNNSTEQSMCLQCEWFGPTSATNDSGDGGQCPIDLGETATFDQEEYDQMREITDGDLTFAPERKEIAERQAAWFALITLSSYALGCLTVWLMVTR